MKWLHTILREILGLFIDDGSFALMILAWIAVITFLFGRLDWLVQWRGLVLFCGLAAILVESAVRYARNKRR